MPQITEEMAGQFARLSRQGQSFRQIGKRFGVDSRTVKSWVEKVEMSREREYWEGVTRQVDVRYLEEHHRLLLYAAEGVMRAVESHPFSPVEDCRSLMASQVQLELERAAELLKSRGMDLFFRSAPTDWHTRMYSRRDRIAMKALNGLMEHEPELDVALKRWESLRARFVRHKNSLADRAKNLLEFQGLGEELAETVGYAIAKATLASRVSHESAGRLSLDRRTERSAAVIIETALGKEEVCMGSPTEMEKVVSAAAWVLEQADLDELVRLGVRACERLFNCRSDLQDRLDLVQMKGRPRGSCSWCPG
jgi:hypothetical protein